MDGERKVANDGTLTEGASPVADPLISQGALIGGAPVSIGRLRRQLRKARRTKPLLFGGAVLTAVFLFISVGPRIIRAEPYVQDMSAILSSPSSDHPFGTDALGRDLLARVAHGGRAALVVSVSSVVLGAVFGVFMGVVAGFLGGVTDRLMIRLMDLLLSFPSIVVAIAFVGIVGGGTSGLIAALTIVATPRFARITRGEVLGLRNHDFVIAATALGARRDRVMVQHILPNLLGPLIVLGSIMMPAAIFLEATLSFFGLGVAPELPTWGRIIADGRQYIMIAPWITLFPGLVLSLTSLGFHLLGDGRRDLRDVHV